MQKKILFGTTNETKLRYVREIVKGLGLLILSPAELGITVTAKEDGKDPRENATKKALVYFTQAKIPALAIDSGLYIDRFAEEKQPGVHVRRIYGNDRPVSDADLLTYYQAELARVGGQSTGRWTTSIALISHRGQLFTETFVRKTLFTSVMSPLRDPDEPLNSLQLDPETGRYIAELSYKERMKAQQVLASGIREFVKRHLGCI